MGHGEVPASAGFLFAIQDSTMAVGRRRKNTRISVSSASTPVRSAFIVTVTGILLMAGSVNADEKDQATLARYMPRGPHSLELSYSHIDTVVENTDVLLFGYTGAFRPNMRIGVTGGITRLQASADPSIGLDENIDELGLSDTLLIFQYDPTARITASPWVPDTVGISAAVLAPTGDADEGLSGDAWLGSFGAGWLINSISHLWVVPAGNYESTFAEGDSAVSTQGAYVSCDVVWVFPFGGWIGYSPSIGREFDADEWVDSHALTIGKLWQRGFGLSFELGKNDRISRSPARDDRDWLVNFYYQF
jgi:hypothetical protein